MNAFKKMDLKKRDLELLVGGGGIERAKPRDLLGTIFRFLFSRKSDLTLETWQELEQKRGITKSVPAPLRDQYSHMRWHV